MTTTPAQTQNAKQEVAPFFRNAQGQMSIQLGTAQTMRLVLLNELGMSVKMTGLASAPSTIAVDFTALGSNLTLTSASVKLGGFTVQSWSGGILTLAMKSGSGYWHHRAPLTIDLGEVTVGGTATGIVKVPVTLSNFSVAFTGPLVAGLICLAAPQAAETGEVSVLPASATPLNGAMSLNPAPAQTVALNVGIPVPATMPASWTPGQIVIAAVPMETAGLSPLPGMQNMTVSAGGANGTQVIDGAAAIWQVALPAGTGQPVAGQVTPFVLSLAGIAPAIISGTGSFVVYNLGFPGCNDAGVVVNLQITPQPVSIASFQANPTTIQAGAGVLSSSLSWSVDNAAMVTLSCAGAVPSQQTGYAVSLESTTTYVLTAYGSGFQTMDAKAVTVSVTPGLQERLIPSNTIMAWNGTAANIPAGWVLCNGQNGAPDLRDRFILGAGGQEQPGASGAGDPHTHTVSALDPPNGFNPSTQTGGGHSHGMPTSWYWINLSCGKYPSICNGGNMGSGTVTQEGGDHTHTVPFSFPNIVTDSTVTGRPPWYALCYVMKS